MERKKLTPDQIADLKKPLPSEAIKPHPSKSYLSTIKVPYVIERLNDVFGIDGWETEEKIIEKQGKMVVVHVTMRFPEYGIVKSAFGGNDNEDLGDAYKGACTDALSKIGSYLYIGMDVYKGHGNGNGNHPPASTPQPAQTKPAPQTQASTQSNGDPVADITIAAVEDGEKKFTVTINGKVAGSKYLGCFEKKLFNAFATHQGSTARIAYRSRETNGRTYVNIVSLLSIDGTEYHEGLPVIRNDNIHGQQIDDTDIPF